MNLKQILTAGAFALSVIPFNSTEAQRTRRIGYKTPSSITSNLGYQRVVREPNFSQVELAPRCDAGIGRIQRTERWKPIIKAVEDKYNIPRNTIYAIVMQESCGDPLQPNSSTDGGLGLAHMQPGTGEEYGLDVYGNSKITGRDTKSGKQINNIIRKCKSDVNCLLRYDERAHPVKNIDGIGRYLANFKQATGSWDTAVRWINSNQKSYLPKINRWKHVLGQKRDSAREDFNRRNAGKFVDGKPLTFDSYIRAFNEMNKNYGLEEYKKGK